MTWFAITTQDKRAFSLHGLEDTPQQAPILADRSDALLTRGTIMFETQPLNDDCPQKLFGFDAFRPYQRGLNFYTTERGGVALVRDDGFRTTTTTATRTDTVRTDVLRVTYAWDGPARWGRLTLEQPEESQVISVAVENPAPLSLGDIRRLMLGQAGSSLSPCVIFAALSDQIEPVGPMPTLLPGTPIATPWGYRAANSLQRGETVTTQCGDVVPVLHSVTRTVPAYGSFQPLRLRAPYFGLVQDIIVAPEQRLLIDGAEVEYLFGQEAVLAPARHLVNGFTAAPEDLGPTVSYSQLLLPRHETLLAAGSALESLYVGRVRRHPEVLEQSLLRDADRCSLPEHGKPSHHVLRQFEAIDLARRRAA